MEESQSKRIEALETMVDHLARKLEALEETVRQLFQEVRSLYEDEDLPQRQ